MKDTSIRHTPRPLQPTARRRLRLGLGLAAAAGLVALGYLAGSLASLQVGGSDGKDGRTVLYWADPMNPSFRSPEPGTAPCGMPLEPVYADEADPAAPDRPSGAITVRADRQQLIGVTTELATRRQLHHSLRLLGTVAVDETRLYLLGSVTQGWVREVSAATSGTLVHAGDVLARYYSQESFNPQQAFIYALNAIDRQNESGQRPPDQGLPFERTVVNTRQALLNVGMTRLQIEHIARTREIDPLVEIRAPADGFVLRRNVYLGQAFKPTTELYAIADLSHVWILADAFETDERFLGPGITASISHPSLTERHEAVVSDVLPEFDAATRTLKVRLDVANPDFRLRPGMFVDVDVPIQLGPALTVSREAVLDSGSHQVVFVDHGDGVFEPRQVGTGWRYAGRVEITRGLDAGERVVSSGNFLLDSESRMRASGAGAPPSVIDPTCGMEVDPDRARAQGLVSTRDGQTFYFCHAGCKAAFDRREVDIQTASTS